MIGRHLPQATTYWELRVAGHGRARDRDSILPILPQYSDVVAAEH
jgi:hypothetical protein